MAFRREFLYIIRIELILIVDAIREYLNDKSSKESIANRLGVKKITLEKKMDFISINFLVQKVSFIDWIKKYMAFEELDSNRNGGIHIATKKKQTLGRTTSFDERVEIVEYCIAHGLNYTETAVKFNISYQQARNYVIKYNENGIEGLNIYLFSCYIISHNKIFYFCIQYIIFYCLKISFFVI